MAPDENDVLIKQNVHPLDHRIFYAPAYDFVRGRENNPDLRPTDELTKRVLQTKVAMRCMIERYGMRNKSVLSVGAGPAHEEFWLIEQGCRVDLIDPLLEEEVSGTRSRVINATRPGLAARLRYFVSDFNDLITGDAGPLYDVCYFSGFAPDELDREAVQASYKRRRTAQEAYESYKSWPDGMPPFLSAVMESAKLIAPGGLFLLQSYCGGCDLLANPHYPKLICQQLNRNGLGLLEIHFFRQAPGIQLIAATAGASHVRAWLERLAAAPPLAEFHGRYPNATLRSALGRWSPDSSYFMSVTRKLCSTSFPFSYVVW
jgi:hypothetical protein